MTEKSSEITVSQQYMEGDTTKTNKNSQIQQQIINCRNWYIYWQYMDAKSSSELDKDLMAPEYGFEIQQLMELAGLSCNYKTQQRESQSCKHIKQA